MSIEKTSRTVVIAGGGTGGHIYPGLAIAKALKKIDPQVQVHFIGTPAGLEVKLIPENGYQLHLIKVGKLNYQGGVLGKIKTLFGIPKAMVQSMALLMELKPEVVLGVGGYASGPFVLAASFLGFRTALWEPNAKPGLTNRLLSRVVKKAFVVFEKASDFLNSKTKTIVGFPVREEIEDLGRSNISKDQSEVFKILVFVGSQGAQAINTVISETICSGKLKNVEWVHQTGANNFDKFKDKYKSVSNVTVMPYIQNIHEKYQWADLVICRSGASTVAELSAAGLPCIFIPLPSAADDHQKKNAEVLKKDHAALMIEQKDLSVERLIQEIEDLRKNPGQYRELQQNIKKFYQPQSSLRIAQLMLENDLESI